MPHPLAAELDAFSKEKVPGGQRAVPSRAGESQIAIEFGHLPKG